MDVRFRRARSDDAATIELLYRALVEQPDVRVTRARLAELERDPTNLVIVGTRDERVVATAFLVICPDVMYGDQPFAVVENIVVDANSRGGGVGTALMGYVADECRARRCTKIMLLSSTHRTDAHRFFERCGYRDGVKAGFVNYLNR